MEISYGFEDTSYKAAGQKEGIRKLVEAFYSQMQRLPEAERILKMHPADLELSIDKLTLFLCGWLGGPQLFAEKYYPIRIPIAHKHLDIGEPERDAWLICMEHAVMEQPYASEFKDYILRELKVPAERIFQVSQIK